MKTGEPMEASAMFEPEKKEEVEQEAISSGGMCGWREAGGERAKEEERMVGEGWVIKLREGEEGGGEEG